MPRTEPPRIALDTSVLIAALQSWHEHHDAAAASLNRALASGSAVLPSRALVEAYAVMTRMPAPHRLSPKDAFKLLESTFKDASPVIQLSSDGYWSFLNANWRNGVAGGVIYDAEIVESAREAGIDQILTLNKKHFERLATEGIRVLTLDPMGG